MRFELEKEELARLLARVKAIQQRLLAIATAPAPATAAAAGGAAAPASPSAVRT